MELPPARSSSPRRRWLRRPFSTLLLRQPWTFWPSTAASPSFSLFFLSPPVFVFSSSSVAEVFSFPWLLSPSDVATEPLVSLPNRSSQLDPLPLLLSPRGLHSGVPLFSHKERAKSLSRPSSFAHAPSRRPRPDTVAGNLTPAPHETGRDPLSTLLVVVRPNPPSVRLGLL